MVHLDITKQEQEILREALEDYISDLRMEIADTDHKDFRDKLKMKKEILNKVVQALS